MSWLSTNNSIWEAKVVFASCIRCQGAFRAHLYEKESFTFRPVSEDDTKAILVFVFTSNVFVHPRRTGILSSVCQWWMCLLTLTTTFTITWAPKAFFCEMFANDSTGSSSNIFWIDFVTKQNSVYRTSLNGRATSVERRIVFVLLQ